MKNEVDLIGRLGQNPEISYTPTGIAVCKFSFATWYIAKDKKKHTTWHQMVAFKKNAENIARYLKQGSLVNFEGMINNGSFEDKEGIKRYYSEVHVTKVIFISSPKNGSPEQNSQQASGQPEDDEYYNISTPPDDDIPF